MIASLKVPELVARDRDKARSIPSSRSTRSCARRPTRAASRSSCRRQRQQSRGLRDVKLGDRRRQPRPRHRRAQGRRARHRPWAPPLSPTATPSGSSPGRMRSAHGAPKRRSDRSGRRRNTARYFTEIAPCRVGPPRRDARCGASSPTCACRSARTRTSPCASPRRSSRGRARAPRSIEQLVTPQDRGEDRRELEGRADRVDHAHAASRSSRHAAGRRQGRRQGVRRHQDQARHASRDLPAGRAADPVHQGLRRHGGADAHRREPQGRRRRARSSARARCERAIDERARRRRRTPAASAPSLVVLVPADDRRAARSRRIGRAIGGRSSTRGASPRTSASSRAPGFLGLDAQTRLRRGASSRRRATFARERMQHGGAPPRRVAARRRPRPDGRPRRSCQRGRRATSTRTASSTSSPTACSATCRRCRRSSKVTRSGVLPERVYLDYSQERLAAYGIQATQLGDALGARNITLPGGVIEVDGQEPRRSIRRASSRTSSEIGDVLVATSPPARRVYLRDLVDVSRDYESPPRFLNYYTSRRTPSGKWRARAPSRWPCRCARASRSPTSARRSTRALAERAALLPEDLIVARTSDQPLQVEENVDLFMTASTRPSCSSSSSRSSASGSGARRCCMALSIPITLAMTFGFMHLLGIDLQQISIASLIIALGLLVDDPVVAGDAIKRELGGRAAAARRRVARADEARDRDPVRDHHQHRRLPAVPDADRRRRASSSTAAGRADVLAGRVAPRVDDVHPAARLLPAAARRRAADRRAAPAAASPRSITASAAGRSITAGWCSRRRSCSLVGGVRRSRASSRQQFFPKDLSYLSYVDVWLPEDAPLRRPTQTAIAGRGGDPQRRSTSTARSTPAKTASRARCSKSITTFVGGGGPRFWFSVSPELQQLNYAQLIIQVNDKHDTAHLVDRCRRRCREIAGRAHRRAPARERQARRDPGRGPHLRRRHRRRCATIAEQGEGDLPRDARRRARPRRLGRRQLRGRSSRSTPTARTSPASPTSTSRSLVGGGDERPRGRRAARRRQADPDRRAAAHATERAQLSDMQNLYVYSSQRHAEGAAPPGVDDRRTASQTEKIRAAQPVPHHHRLGFPVAGALPSEVMDAVRAEARRARADAAARLPARDRRRGRGAEEGLQRAWRSCMAHLGRARSSWRWSPVQERGQAAHRLRGDPVRRRRRAGRARGHGHAVRLHGVPRHRQPHRRHRQPRHRALRLHRGDAREGRAASRGAARRRASCACARC